MNLDALLPERLAILGGTGSGKSYTARGLAERILAKKGRLGVIDPTGVWWGLRSEFPVVLFGGDHADLPIHEHAGRVVATAVASSQQSWILDTSALKTKAAERRFMLEFLDGLYDANRAPITLIVDEADRFSPQRMTPETARLHERMEEIVRRGRVRGFTPWLITQRPASLNKDVLSMATAYICMRMTGAHDRKAIADVIEGQADKIVAKAIVDAMPRHKVGHGMAWAPGQDILLPVAFPKIKTLDTMVVSALTQRPLPPIDLGALKDKLATVEEETKANDPALLRKRIAELEREKASAKGVMGLGEKEMKAEYDRGVAYGYALSHKEWADRNIVVSDDIGRAQQALVLASRALTAALPKFQRADIPRTPKAVTPPAATPLRTPSPAPPPQPRGNGHANEEVGTGGLRRILVALAQRPEGLTNRQIGVRATLSSKSGTFSTYLSKARSSGWIADKGDLRVITEEGVAALGHYDPLPTGQDLLQHWLRELGDSGAARILGVVAEAYPESLSNAEVGERANLSHASGTFSTYLSKLRTLELVTGRGEVRASDELF